MTQQPSSPVCLVLIDLQLDFYTRIPDVKAAFPDLPHNITQLTAFAREHDIEVVHVRAHYDSDSCAWWELYHDNRPHMRALNDGRGQVVSIEPEPFAAERPGEAVIVKHNFDGFLGTNLEEYLRSRGAKVLLIGGLVTSCCVLLTTVGAFFRGFRPIVIDDCCGDRTHERHAAALDTYNYVMKRVLLADVLAKSKAELAAL